VVVCRSSPSARESSQISFCASTLSDIGVSDSLTVVSVTVRIPTTLRPLSGGASTVSVDGANLRDVLKALDVAHPGFASKLLDTDGNLHKFVNVFVADDDVRYLQGLDTPVLGGQVVSIVPAVAGGC
jgi:molybdopterin synthase sulfur carrier subunit